MQALRRCDLRRSALGGGLKQKADFHWVNLSNCQSILCLRFASCGRRPRACCWRRWAVAMRPAAMRPCGRWPCGRRPCGRRPCGRWQVALCQIVKLLFVDNLTQIRIVGFLRARSGFGFLGQIVKLSCRKNPPRFVVGF